MPDSGISDGSVYTSSFHDTYVRQQVVTQCTSAARPTGVEGRLIYETDTDRMWVYSGSAWVFQNYFSTAGRPGVILTDAAQTIATATTTDITWGTEVSDVDGWTSGGSATLTVPSGWDGRYVITYSGAWSSGPGSPCSVVLYHNGSTVYEALGSSAPFSVPCVTAIRSVAATDTLKVAVYHSAGANRDIVSRLEIAWLGR